MLRLFVYMLSLEVMSEQHFVYIYISYVMVSGQAYTIREVMHVIPYPHGKKATKQMPHTHRRTPVFGGGLCLPLV